jgi:hypothetical protein
MVAAQGKSSDAVSHRMAPLHQQAITVAVAEDPFVGRYVRTLLTKHGFQTVENDPRQTRKLMESGDLRPDVLITNDPDLFTGFAEQVSLVYMAASPDPARSQPFRRSRMVRKPFQASQLIDAVTQLVMSVLP